MENKLAKSLNEPVKQKAEVKKNPIYLVAIGASAGGLESLEILIKTIPKNDFLTYVIIQHLDPHKKSIMDKILTKYTDLKVKLIENGDKLKENTIFLNPADKYVTIHDDTFILEDYQQEQSLHFAIDYFFSNAAKDKGEYVIGVILSGTGSDGTLGINAIKVHGGLVIVQNTTQAKYEGMPQNAINTGIVDIILDAEKMIDEILLYVRHPILVLDDYKSKNEDNQLNYSQLFSIIRTKTGNDFSNYKLTTIKRRIARRMMAKKIVKVKDYLQLLKNDYDETLKLSKEFLITVTHFFRDHKSFEAIEESVIPTLLKNNKEYDNKIRIWIPGCATGEEAYSVAILFYEAFEKKKLKPNFQIFATDLDDASIIFARQGMYANIISDKLSTERLNRFFTIEGKYFKIKKEIRETIIFAEHNLIKDAPFSKLDLICCRNVIIYLEQPLQKKIIRLFYTLLNEKGFLFLGPSESIGEFNNLFIPIHSKYKIFQKSFDSNNKLSVLKSIGSENYPGQIEIKKEELMVKPNYLKEYAESVILENYSYPGIIVDKNFNILYFHGATDKYLSIPSGEANFNILNMVKDVNLRNKLNASLLRIFKVRELITIDNVKFYDRGTIVNLKVILKPLTLTQLDTIVTLIIFQEETVLPIKLSKGKSSPKKSIDVKKIEIELQSTKETLQSTIEELEASNEELKSTNEELQSTNEELQSTNEELETSKEELQSTNEELITTNSELQNNIVELSKATDDINNLLASTEIETIFLDNDLRIKRFTPAMKKIYNLIQSDINRPIGDITSNINYENIFQDCKEVLDTLVKKEKEIFHKNGKYYSVRILPYRTVSNIIEGIVLTFIDISALKQTEKLKHFEVLINDSNDAVLMFGLDGIINLWNKGAELLYGYTSNEAIGMHLKNLMPDKISENAHKFILKIKNKNYLKSYESKRINKDKKVLSVSITATLLKDEKGIIIGIATTERDITEYVDIKQKYKNIVTKGHYK